MGHGSRKMTHFHLWCERFVLCVEQYESHAGGRGRTGILRRRGRHRRRIVWKSTRRWPIVDSQCDHDDDVEGRHHGVAVDPAWSTSSVGPRCSTSPTGGASVVRPQVAQPDAASTADVRQLHGASRRPTRSRSEDVQEAGTSTEADGTAADDHAAAAVRRSDTE